jgi:hypothetical protein
MKLETLYAIMLSDNYRAISLMKKMGFVIEYLDDGTAKATLDLREEELASCPERKDNEETSIQEYQPRAEQKDTKSEEAAKA